MKKKIDLNVRFVDQSLSRPNKKKKKERKCARKLTKKQQKLGHETNRCFPHDMFDQHITNKENGEVIPFS